MKPLVLFVSVLLLVGCTGPTGGPASSAAPTTTCSGDAASSTYVLNLNATPAVSINGAKVSVSSLSRDPGGPVAAMTVLDGDLRTTSADLRVGSTLAVGTGRLQVTQICVVENLPSPMPPGTLRGSVGLAAVG